jgi:hypothetical protein
MNTQNSLVKKIIYSTVCMLLTLPLICAFFPGSKGSMLNNIPKNEFTPKYFTWSNFFSSKFQDNAEAATKQNIGFANNWIRLNNGLNFKLFRYSCTEKLVLGKTDYFYEEMYITEYLGRNFIGDFFVKKKVEALKRLQMILKKEKDIDLILVFEPGKAYFSPDQIPDHYHPEIKSISNFESFLYYCRKENINYLDLNNYFKEQKKRTKHLLYSKYGVHWSSYGMWQAIIQLAEKIEKDGKFDLPDIIQISDSTSSINKDLDFDLEPPMNLLTELPHEKMYFPIMRFSSDSARPLPKVLTIADSYYWSIWNSSAKQQLFSKNDYWYYNKTIYPDIWDPAVYVIDSTRKQSIENQNIILLMITDANLYNFGWDFIEQTLKIFDPSYSEDIYLTCLNELMNNPQQYKDMTDESIRKQIPFKDVLYKRVHESVLKHLKERKK